MGGVKTYADGGSATSQASDLETNRWQSRPWAARALRASAFLAPLVGSFVLTRAYAALVPPEPIGRPAYWGGMLVVASATAIVIERWSRSLLPLAAMFRLSLAFPDQAPTRFGVALRGGTTKRLADRVEGVDETAAATELLALVKELSAHDPMTRGHSERVRAYSDLIAEEMGLSREERDRLAWGALAHDVGKLDVDPAILNKPDKPTSEEWAIIRGHPAGALARMAPLYPWLGQWALAASQHHERWDGHGYPAGLAGTEISLAGRIVAVADAYDVMTATRSYKPALEAEAARAELTRNAGSQFDPDVVRAFLRVGLGRMRAVGPLAWLSEVAWLARIPQSVSAVGSTATSVAVAATVSVASAVVPAMADEPPTEGVPRSVEAAAPAVPDVDDDPAPAAPSNEPAPPTPSVTSTTSEAPASTTSTIAPAEDAAPTSTIAPAEDPAPTSTIAPAEDSVPTSTTSSPAPTTTTTSIAASTTTSAPATTTTTSTTTTTTTTAAPAETDFADAVFLEGKPGSATTFLKIDSNLSTGPLGNLDSDRNTDIGLTLLKGSGLADTDDDKRQRFWAQSLESTVLNGMPTVDLWVATPGFDTAATGSVVIGLYDCAANKTAGCVLLASGSASFDQAAFGGDFGAVEVQLSPVDVTLADNRSLILSIAVDPSSASDLWLALGTSDYPTSFEIR